MSLKSSLCHHCSQIAIWTFLSCFQKAACGYWALLCLTNLISKQAFSLKSNQHSLTSTAKSSLFLKFQTIIQNYQLTRHLLSSLDQPNTQSFILHLIQDILWECLRIAQEAFPSHSCFYSFLLLSKNLIYLLLCIICHLIFLNKLYLYISPRFPKANVWILHTV